MRWVSFSSLQPPGAQPPFNHNVGSEWPELVTNSLPLQNWKERGWPQAHLFTSHTKNEATEALKARRRVLKQFHLDDLIWPGSPWPTLVFQGTRRASPVFQRISGTMHMGLWHIPASSKRERFITSRSTSAFTLFSSGIHSSIQFVSWVFKSAPTPAWPNFTD